MPRAKKTQRIRQLANVSATLYRKANTRQLTPVAEIPAPDNALKLYIDFLNPDRPQAGQTYYLAVIIELASRRVVGLERGCRRTAYEITLSCSTKSSPWQNGFMESFFGKFKPELGHPSGYATPETLFERIAANIYYYNNIRIHTALKMSTVAYATRLEQVASSEVQVRDSVLQKVGA